MSTQANYASVSPRSQGVLLVAKDAVAANVVPTSTANTFLGFTGGASGSKINEIVFAAGLTTEAGIGYVWIATIGSPPTAYDLYDTFAISVVTVSLTTPQTPYRLRKQYTDLYLANGQGLYYSHNESGTTNQSNLVVTTSGADF